jgi:hypothetical protein
VILRRFGDGIKLRFVKRLNSCLVSGFADVDRNCSWPNSTRLSP